MDVALIKFRLIDFLSLNPTMTTSVSSPFINIAAYKFVRLDGLAQRRSDLRRLCQELQLKGTILLSAEGINLFLAGTPENIQQFLSELRAHPEFSDLEAKESPSDHQPFSRLLVRLKKEIITLGVDGIDPVNHPSPKLKPTDLRDWIRQGKKFHFLDTRNRYEIEVGTFAGAVDLQIDSFRQFPEAIRQLPEAWKDEPIVMFCTGGIRCEKAGPLMEREGFRHIYQLEGGILKYFEECGGEGYRGDCFVFDKRVAVNPDLHETDTGLCYACQAVLSVADQQHPHYQPPNSCPHCYQSAEQRMRTAVERRNAEIARLVTPLPGSIPEDNIRPLNVPERFDRFPLIDFLRSLHAHAQPGYWEAEVALGRIRLDNQILQPDSEIRAGWRLQHLFPQNIEPDVNAQIKIIYEDEALVGIDKPAPLPMHPCGRFNRNTLISILDRAYAPQRLRMLHRLDANTTGVVVLARTKDFARRVHPQFSTGLVEKRYVALVHGEPQTDRFSSDLKISRQTHRAGGRFADPESGLESRTDFRVIWRRDGRSLIECKPQTGRTNQIRIHLASLGFPIVGDQLYRSPADCFQSLDSPSDEPQEITQTLSIDDQPLCLHSWSIALLHPQRPDQEIEIQCELPRWAIAD